ncbi:hypothetical protein [Nocardia sp. NPDC057440]
MEKVRGRTEVIEHLGSAHTDAELGLLMGTGEKATEDYISGRFG